jgi:steroid delta-isomerase-like uncharacterized protein
MDSQALKDTTRRWITGIWDNGDLSLIEEMTAEGYAFRLPRPDTTGREAFPDLVNAFRTAFPDLNNTIEEQVVEGSIVVTRGTSRGTHQAPFGDLPATGKAIEVPWMMITRFEGDLIVEDREFYDEFGLMMQLGVIPEPS